MLQCFIILFVYEHAMPAVTGELARMLCHFCGTYNGKAYYVIICTIIIYYICNVNILVYYAYCTLIYTKSLYMCIHARLIGTSNN